MKSTRIACLDAMYVGADSSGGSGSGSGTGGSRSMGGLTRGMSSRSGGGWESDIEIDMLQVIKEVWGMLLPSYTLL